MNAKQKAERTGIIYLVLLIVSGAALLYRGNDAVAARDCALYVLSLEKFNFLAEEHKRIAFMIVSKLARTLAIRLRHTDEELTLLQEF